VVATSSETKLGLAELKAEIALAALPPALDPHP
jgi:hypothetical protein